MPTAAKRKHAIKAADRLVGNTHLHADRERIAAAITAELLRETNEPVILIDTMEIRHRVVALSAALPFKGRSMPIWSKVVSTLKVKIPVIREFLDELERVLPAGSRPILVTDAGFEAPWLNEVIRRKWHYVSRVRGQQKICHEGEWKSCRELHALAGNKHKDLGEAQLPMNVEQRRRRRLVLSARPICKHRQVTTRTGPSRDTNYKIYRANAYEPLLLATSLDSPASHIVCLYKKRMQIEQMFRDEKSYRHGWELRHSRTRHHRRYETLLLIAMIAMTIQLLLGLAAERKNLHHQHQANTERSRRVISLFLLGRLVVLNDQSRAIRARDIDQAFGGFRRFLAELEPSRCA